MFLIAEFRFDSVGYFGGTCRIICSCQQLSMRIFEYLKLLKPNEQLIHINIQLINYSRAWSLFWFETNTCRSLKIS